MNEMERMLERGYGETPVRVRYAETDQMGVVYHANYLVWFEIGRVEFIRQTGLDYAAMEREGETTHIVVGRDMKKRELPEKYAERFRELIRHMTVGRA